jgi:hypothetical protein
MWTDDGKVSVICQIAVLRLCRLWTKAFSGWVIPLSNYLSLLPAAEIRLCLNILQDCHWSQREGWSRFCSGEISNFKTI